MLKYNKFYLLAGIVFCVLLCVMSYIKITEINNLDKDIIKKEVVIHSGYIIEKIYKPETEHKWYPQNKGITYSRSYKSKENFGFNVKEENEAVRYCKVEENIFVNKNIGDYFEWKVFTENK